MPRNGSGTYSLPAGNPVVTGTTISSTVQNATMADVAAALTASITADGQTPATANLPMGGFKHTGVAAAAAGTDYARFDQVLPLVSGKITADFTNATILNRALFQTTTANGGTVVGAIPNGISTASGFMAESSSTDPANGSAVRMLIDGAAGAAYCESLARGTGVIQPLILRAGDGRLDLAVNGNAVFGQSLNVGAYRTVTAINDQASGVAGARFLAQSDVGFITMQAGNTAEGGSMFLFANSTGPLQVMTGNAQPLIMGANNVEYLRCNPATGQLQAYGLPTFFPRAWVNFNGTGTVAIRGSGNVLSITDGGTGDYTVNFATALPDADYAAVATASLDGATDNYGYNADVTTQTTTTLRVRTGFNTGSAVTADVAVVNIVVMR